MGANTKFKDSVFSSLFSKPELLRELYSALKGIDLPPDLPVTINTLQDAVFKGRINDISFEIGDKLVVLIEHQSTINPNMALRLLIYIVRVYEKITEDRNIYASKLIRLPRPEFFVLYNGISPYPDETILKLSDAFESTASMGLPDKEANNLELMVKVLNINQGRNGEIAQKCKTLSGYSIFVGKVQEYERENMCREEAIKRAVKYCLEHDILKEFFFFFITEVMNMLITEWNWDDALAVRFEEGLEEGMEKSREDIARNALIKGLPLDVIHDITGLDIETIKSLEKKSC
jgi:hypothetical protein